MESFDKTKLILPGAILISALMISSSLIYAKGVFNRALEGNIAPTPVERKDVSVDDDPSLGSDKAKVTVIEFSDYQCPFCRSFWSESLPNLKREYIETGKVKFVYRDYPLSFHPMAKPSAIAANCAGEQGKYWPMHDTIFSEQEKQGGATIQFTVQDLETWAQMAGLNIDNYRFCANSGKYDDEIAKDTNDGAAAGVDGTPTFFINGKMVVGAQPYSVIKAVIEEEL